jgi:cytochrome c biogenesis factor
MRTSAPSKLPFILVFFLVIAIAVATVLENRFDTHYAMQHVYGAWWFTGLWALLALAGCWLIYKRKMWRQPSVFLLHLSFLVILIGALTTHITSHRGMVHLREGETCRSYWVKDKQGLYTLTEQTPFYLALKDFQVLYDADGITPSDYVSQVVIATKEGKEETTISMNNIGRVKGFRIYQTSFDDDLAGSVFTISYDPWGTAITYMGYILLAISMIWVSLKRNEKLKENKEKLSKNSQLSTVNCQLSTLLLAFAGTIMASYMVIAICRSPLVPILRSPYLFVHVGTIMLSYILLVVSIVRRQVLRPAVFLLATGIFLGAVWANVSWGTYWSWDPKESWALITLLVYSIPLHNKSLPWFNSIRNYRIYSLLALACLLMTYFGVNFLLGGMHSYAG